MVSFHGMRINGWRQFKNIDIQFHNRLTILTGANGAGKSTILYLLAQHFGWSTQFASTIKKRKTGETFYSSDVWFSNFNPNSIEDLHDFPDVEEENQLKSQVNTISVGTLQYSNQNTSEIFIDSKPGNTFAARFQYQQVVIGMHVHSHKTVNLYYNPVPTIPAQATALESLFDGLYGTITNFFQGGHLHKRPLQVIKENIIALAVFGYGNEAVVADARAREAFEEFQKILQIILPSKIGFEKIVVSVPEVLFETKTGIFAIDAMSGGITSLLETAWQIFTFLKKHSNLREDIEKKFVITIDEPENHLHPEMQQTFLRNLMYAFPNVQFIVATHSPFIISSIPKSNVYALKHENGSIKSYLIDDREKMGTANDILREVLGLDYTMPVWVEEKIQQIVKDFSGKISSEEEIKRLRIKLEQEDLGEYAPEILLKVI